MSARRPKRDMKLSAPPKVVLTPDSPYPGLAAFEEEQAAYFRGRKTPTAEMIQLIRSYPLALLFGASGLGKTSLLEAGVFPMLRKEDYFPVSVRLEYDESGGSLIDSLLHQITEAAARQEVEIDPIPLHRPQEEPDEEPLSLSDPTPSVPPVPSVPPGSAAGGAPEASEECTAVVRSTLWGFLHFSRFWSRNNHRLTPLLALDQFEELFTKGRDDERSFALVTALSELIEYHRPERVADLVREGSLEVPPLKERWRPRCVIAIREDFLPDLEGIRDRLPALSARRYRLGRLQEADAIAAICDPSPGLVSREVAGKILDYLAEENRSRLAARKIKSPPERRDRDVEPAILSLFCRGLNERRIQAGKKEIDAALVEASKGLIVRDFYTKTVADIDRATRDIVETALITSLGYRTTLAWSTALDDGASEDSLRALVDRRLLRLEDRFGETHVELIHDVLTQEIPEIRDRRERERWIRLLTWIAAGALLLLGAAAWLFVTYVTLPGAERLSQYRLLLAQINAARDKQDAAKCDELHDTFEKKRMEEQDPPLPLHVSLEASYRECAANELARRAKLSGELDAEARALAEKERHEQALLRWVEAARARGDKRFDMGAHPLPDPRLLLTLRGFSARVGSVAFGPDGAIYSASDGVRISNGQDGIAVREIRLPHLLPKRISVRSVEQGQEKKVLLVAVLDSDIDAQQGTIGLWDLGASAEPRLFSADHKFADALVLPNGTDVLAAFPGVARVSFQGSSPVLAGKQEPANAFVLRLGLDATGDRLIAGGMTRKADARFAAVWRADLTGLPLRTLALDPARGESTPAVNAAVFLPDGKGVALGLSSGEIVVKDTLDSPARTVYANSAVSVLFLAVCANGPTLYAAIQPTSDRSAGALLRIEPGKELLRAASTLYTLPGAAVINAALSPDCERVASVWEDRTVRVIATGDGRPFPESPADLIRDLRRRLGYNEVGAGDKTVLPDSP